jgi:RNA polymerase sigma-70 factor (ECF subfamily)
MKDIETDEHAMERLCQGQGVALDALVRKWSPRLATFITRMCGYLGRTDDIHQDIWTRVYVYRNSYRPTQRFSSYLFGIAHNVCCSAMRQESWWHKVTKVGDAGASLTAADNAAPALDLMIEAERKARLDIAIAELPAAQKAVVLLYLLCDQDYRQIAHILNNSQSTVRSNMHHALKKLRDTLSWAAAAESQVDRERQTN